MNIVKRLVVKAFKLDLLAKELARARRTADAQREIIRADRINAQKAADENWELILRMQNSIMAKTTNSPELLRELLRTATVVKENWESALCGGNGGLTHKEMAPFIDALREMKNSVGFAERKGGLMSDRPQDETSKPPFKRIFDDGPSLFERMMQGPPDKTVREDNGQVWHYWKIQDDEDEESR